MNLSCSKLYRGWVVVGEGVGGGGGRRGGISFGEGKGAFLLANPKTDFDPSFARFGGRKEREIQS